MSVGKIVKGLEPTEVAKAAVARIENAVKREVITPDKLVRTPSSDLYDKSCYMSTEKFWEDNKPLISARNLYDAYIERAKARYGSCRDEKLKSRAEISFEDYLQKNHPKEFEILKKQKLYIDKMRKLQAYKDANL